MNTRIRDIPLDRLVPHPDHPNRMSRAAAEKLVRNIERVGRYEPLVVRPCPGRRGFFQIINGCHRCDALRKLGCTAAEVIVWHIDDEQTDILLATLNRLSGRDALDQKRTLLRRLSARIPTRKLARLLPQTFGQIERLTVAHPLTPRRMEKAEALATPMVFFLDDAQRRQIEEALTLAGGSSTGQSRAAKRAAALTQMAMGFSVRIGRDAARPQEP